MECTVRLDEALLEQARHLLGTKTVQDTIEKGLQEIVRRERPAEARAGQGGASSFFDAGTDLESLARQQGVAPIGGLDELRADFWPDDESVDDFIATVRRWRREGDRKRGA